MIEQLEDLTALICAENGKAQDDARAEVRYAAEFFRWFGEEAVRTDGSYGLAPAGGAHTIVTHRPVGVAALITPWNFPAAMATRKIDPAMAAGCTVVLKTRLGDPADHVLNASMELGGNAPFIVTADADVTAAVEGR